MVLARSGNIDFISSRDTGEFPSMLHTHALTGDLHGIRRPSSHSVLKRRIVISRDEVVSRDRIAELGIGPPCLFVIFYPSVACRHRMDADSESCSAQSTTSHVESVRSHVDDFKSDWRGRKISLWCVRPHRCHCFLMHGLLLPYFRSMSSVNPLFPFALDFAGQRLTR